VFFPVVTILYWILPHKFRWLHLLIASCIFYAAFVPIYLLILVGTIVIDYIAGIVIERTEGKQKKMYLALSVITNVGILCVFKYYNFFLDNIYSLFHSLNITAHPIPYLSMILPIGLSFHTFQAMSYTIEVYRGKQKAERHFGIYALYVMFYPQLVAGPIERPQNVLHQFHEKHTFDSMQFFDGLRLMLWGFFKKLVIADRLAIYVSGVYGHADQYHYLNLIIATIFFSVQIYCDFSGYSDIALGTAKTMGYELMVNFNRPYFANNIKEFWKRWHISLSTWFRDYLYISLGGNRVSVARIYLNTAIVFLISGFWHGASWNFVIWGALHTVYILLYNFKTDILKFKLPNKPLTNAFSWVFTFCLVALAWVFFRANTTAEAFLIVKKMLTLDNTHTFQLAVTGNGVEFGKTSFVIAFLFTSILFLTEWFIPDNIQKLNSYAKTDVVFCSLILTVIICFGIFYNASFIYFQF
jgi:D-alanyl-lipoteichoic acid acyltransferase DltB (MBOAT superfamily)